MRKCVKIIIIMIGWVTLKLRLLLNKKKSWSPSMSFVGPLLSRPFDIFYCSNWYLGSENLMNRGMLNFGESLIKIELNEGPRLLNNQFSVNILTSNSWKMKIKFLHDALQVAHDKDKINPILPIVLSCEIFSLWFNFWMDI